MGETGFGVDNAATASAGEGAMVSGATVREAVAVPVLAGGSTFAVFAAGAVACTVGELLRSDPPWLVCGVGVSAFGGSAAVGVGDASASSDAVWAPPELDMTTPSATSTLVCDGEAPVGVGESGVDGGLVDEGGDALPGDNCTPASAPDAAASALAGAASVADASPESGLAHAAAAGIPTAAPTPSATANAPTLPTHQA
jgi:hypothetical protein